MSFTVHWGNAQDQFWDWVETGVTRRFGRATLDGVLMTQFEKARSPDALPGRLRSSDIPQWIEGALGHHTLPRSSLSLFFLRHGARIEVVGVGSHAHDRRRHNKDYLVVWWREAKSKATGPKRLTISA